MGALFDIVSKSPPEDSSTFANATKMATPDVELINRRRASAAFYQSKLSFREGGGSGAGSRRMMT